jgi:O-antigen ligase
MTKLSFSLSSFPLRFSAWSTPAQPQAITPFWLGLWAFALTFSWLLPNHYRPWAAFHADSWIALVLGLGSAGIILRSPAAAVWHWPSVIVAGLVPVPLIQYAFNMLPFAGQAWISTTYLLGLLLALLTGARWESVSPGQLAGGLFIAIGAASVLSVGLQLHQWLGLDGLEFLSMGLSGGRPYGNFGQPNQLGTLLLWGLLACAWGVVSGKVRAPIATLMASFLLIGIALTQSRTAWLGLSVLLCAAWIWRRHWPSKWMPWVVTGLGLYFLLCNLALLWVLEALHLTVIPDLEARMSVGVRPLVWRLFIDAALQRPWFGYGWTSVANAQFAAALEHPILGTTFAQSHNLFIDLVLWCGIPIGLSVSAYLVYWFVKCIRSIADIRDAILLMFVAVVANHAMLELPLHYAYFLLPTGLVMGVLNARLVGRSVLHTPRWVLAVIWSVTIALLSVTVRDYFRVEANVYAFRFEMARVGNLPPAGPPDVLLLTQFRESLRLARFEPRGGLSEANLQWMRNVAQVHLRPGELYKLATALALNGHPDEAQLILKRMCKIVPDETCALTGRVWAEQSLKEPKIAAISWPN